METYRSGNRLNQENLGLVTIAGRGGLLQMIYTFSFTAEMVRDLQSIERARVEVGLTFLLTEWTEAGWLEIGDAGTNPAAIIYRRNIGVLSAK